MNTDKAAGKVLIVIPAYNEGKTLEGLTAEIRRLFPLLDILVVDDGSRRPQRISGGAKLIRHPFNLGDGAARQSGFLYALRHGYDFVIHLDADGQHLPAEIPSVLQPLQDGQADVVVGSRFLGRCNYKVPFLRRVGMRLFSLVCSLVVRRRITDPTNGFRGLNRRALELYTRGFYPQHYPDADVIISSHFRGLAIREVPVTVDPSASESLHRGMRIFYYIYKMFLSTFVAILGRQDQGRPGKCPSSNS